MNRARYLIVCLTLIATAAYAEDKGQEKKKSPDLTDPVEILKKADAAAKTVKAVRYEVEVVGTGALEPLVGKLKADITATGVAGDRATGFGFEKYKFDAEITFPNAPTAPPGSETTEGEATAPTPVGEVIRRISGGSDNDTFFVIHHHSKTAYEDIDPAVMGGADRMIASGTMIEFILDEPFTDEINGREVKLLGSKKIAGEDCYEIHVTYQAERAPQAIWCFSKKDFLPRSRVDIYPPRDGREGGVRKTISKLKVNPKLDKAAFTLKLPKGYTKTDDFAPSLRQR